MMSLGERLAWIHRDATTLKTDDLVALKHALKKLITESIEVLELVRKEIHNERRGQSGRECSSAERSKQD